MQQHPSDDEHEVVGIEVQRSQSTFRSENIEKIDRAQRHDHQGKNGAEFEPFSGSLRLADVFLGFLISDPRHLGGLGAIRGRRRDIADPHGKNDKNHDHHQILPSEQGQPERDDSADFQQCRRYRPWGRHQERGR